MLHSPSEQRYLVDWPEVGAGTNPLVPAAVVVAPVNTEYVVSVSAIVSESAWFSVNFPLIVPF